MSEKAQNAIRGTYPADKQYLACPGTKEGRGDLNTFARRRAEVDSWIMEKRRALLSIKT